MNPIIREAKPEDRPFIEEISRLTWGGDYLAYVFEEWVKEGGLYVLELGRTVIGTVRITVFPQRVGWMEGLRVHPDYRGRGYGKILHRFVLGVGEALFEGGKIDALEFSTQAFNQVSVSLGTRDGFSGIGGFYNLKANVSDFEPLRPERTDLVMSDMVFGIMPPGWKFVHKSPEALEWLMERGEANRMGSLKFLAPKVTTPDLTFTPLSVEPDIIAAMLPAMAWVAKEKGLEVFYVVLPEELGREIPSLREFGLQTWGDVEGPNVLVFRKELG